MILKSIIVQYFKLPEIYLLETLQINMNQLFSNISYDCINMSTVLRHFKINSISMF
jgi:hypothetical protein